VKHRRRIDSTPADEGEWLRRARQGEENAFARLVETYQVPVFNLCYRMLGDADLAEDAAQETFLRAYRHLAAFDTRRSFRTWVLSIAAHHSIDQGRKRRLPIVPLEALEPDSGPKDPEPGPEASMVRRQVEADVQVMLAGLPPADRAALILRYWDEMSYEEMAGVLETTVSSVKSRLHRARKQLAADAQPTGRGAQRANASAV
jgi:RNA polymerase sigma-70 factor (ECF subfamily)